VFLVIAEEPILDEDKNQLADFNEDNNQIVDMKQFNEDEEQIKHNNDEEIDEVLPRLMQIFPYFSGMNYGLWENKMEYLQSLTNLLHFVQEDCVNPYDKRRDACALYLFL
jgi:hypothetical protein